MTDFPLRYSFFSVVWATSSGVIYYFVTSFFTFLLKNKNIYIYIFRESKLDVNMIRRIIPTVFKVRNIACGSIMPIRFQSSGPEMSHDDDPNTFYDDFDFTFLDELCDEISGDLGTFIPEHDFSLLGNENTAYTK